MGVGDQVWKCIVRLTFKIKSVCSKLVLSSQFIRKQYINFFSAAKHVFENWNDTVKKLQYSQPEPESQGSSERCQEWCKVENGEISYGHVHFVVEDNVNPWDIQLSGCFVELVHKNGLDQGFSAGQGAA